MRTPRRHVPTASGAGLLVALVGGYGFGWRWTGFADNGELWDMLHLLLLPVLLTALPVWYRTHLRLAVEWRIALSVLAAAFVIVVIGGYDLGWTWTGFAGNRLWDWLQLLVLPVALAALPLWMDSRPARQRWWRVAVLMLIVAFAVLVIGGYGLSWRWTGFAGNTLWDWLQLLLVPFVLPVAVLLFARARSEHSDA